MVQRRLLTLAEIARVIQLLLAELTMTLMLVQAVELGI